MNMHSTTSTVRPFFPVRQTSQEISDELAQAVVSQVKAIFHGKPHLLPTTEAKATSFEKWFRERQYRMPLGIFVSLLYAAERAGNREHIPCGRELVRLVLDTLAKPFGLRVVAALDPQADIRSVEEELLQASIAIASAHAFIGEALPNGFTDLERKQAALRIGRADRELAELAAAVAR